MYFSKALVVLSVALSALASPHVARGASHHAALAHRAAMPVAEPAPVVTPVKKIRKRSSRCVVRSSSSSSSSAAPTSSSIVPPQNVASDPTTTSAEPTSTKKAETTTSQAEPTTTKAAPTTTKTTSAAKATTSSTSSSSASDPLGILTGTHTGDGTYYGTGLGSCGITNSDTDLIAAVSHELYDNYPGYSGANPNDNPLCGRKIKATYEGKSVTVTAVDRCTGCDIWALDFSPSAFSQLADESVGRIHGMTWEWA